MSLIRRYSAAAFAASVLLLGACGSESPVVPSAPETGDVNDNPRIISLSTNLLAFISEDGEVPAPQWLDVSGLVAIGSYVLFQNTVFSPSTAPWLRMDPTPVFQRDPLAWRFRFWVDPSNFANLANGVYSADMDVVVPAALNSPQTLSSFLCKGASCLMFGSNVVSSLSGADQSWNRGTDVNNIPGAYFFDDYFLAIPPFTTAHITNEGASCGAGQTLGDAYLYAFRLDGTYISHNDDGLCGLNSYMPIHNGTAMTWTIRVRATSFGGGATGTYRLRVNAGPPFLMAEAEVSPQDQDVLRSKANGTAGR